MLCEFFKIAWRVVALWRGLMGFKTCLGKMVIALGIIIIIIIIIIVCCILYLIAWITER